MNVNMLRDKIMLVTGGAGFIGSHLVHALTGTGARVTVLDNLQAGSWGNVGGMDHRPETADRRPPECVVGDVRDHGKVVELVKTMKSETRRLDQCAY